MERKSNIQRQTRKQQIETSERRRGDYLELDRRLVEKCTNVSVCTDEAFKHNFGLKLNPCHFIFLIRKDFGKGTTVLNIIHK